VAISVKVNPPSGTIVLDRPDLRNALDQQTIRELSQALSDLHQERRVRAVILMGAGQDFCAGLDLKELQQSQRQAEQQAQLQFQEAWMGLSELIEQAFRYPKPLIAAVDGAALGAGLALVAACDLVIASDRARFGAPTVRRGLASGLTAPLLTFRVGASMAARLLLTGEPMPAADLERIGFVHRVVQSAQVWAAAQEAAQQCAASPHEAIQMTKRLLNETIGETLIGLLHVGAAMAATACTTEAAAEGVAAFVEKRPPRWP
jgi:enoyl-CoA hydratase/carnithine racemase